MPRASRRSRSWASEPVRPGLPLELGTEAAQWAGQWSAPRALDHALTARQAANLISKLHKSAGSKASEQPAFVLYDTFDDVRRSYACPRAQDGRPCPSSLAMQALNIRA